MMRLVAVQTIQVTAESPPGTVPIIGVGAVVTITRGWFQCDGCSLIGALDELISPMMPPPCTQGCDRPEQ